jgi:hypothetical protein
LAATGSAAVASASELADFASTAAISSAFADTGDGAAKHTKSPVVSINTERPLALMVM